MSVDVSPDGQTLIFDLLGDIYSLPISGGEATPITTGGAWDQAPRFSPNGKSVYFVSARERFRDIWQLTLSDNSLRQITKSDADIMGTHGQTMVFAAIGYVWMMDLETGRFRRLTDSSDFEYMPALSPNGEFVAYISFARNDEGYGTGRLMIADVAVGAPRTLLASANATYLLPKWSHDGSKIALIREVRDESTTKAAFGWTGVINGEFQEVAVSPTSDEYLGWRLYARFVGFDTNGRRLLFSYRRSRFKAVLASAGLDGSGLRTLALGDTDVGGIVPAADLNHLALMRRDGNIWVVPFDATREYARASTTLQEAQRISVGGGYYAEWNGSEEITFGFGQNIYRYDLRERKLESLRVKLAFEKPKARQELLTSPISALAAFEQHKNLGVHVLKEFNTPTRSQRRWLAAAAREKGLGIVSHIQSFDGMMTRVVDGYTGGDHPYIPAPFFKDVRELLRQTGYIWTPNIGITTGTVGSGQRKKDYFCHAVFDWQRRTSPPDRDVDPICRPEGTSELSVPFEVHRVGWIARQAASAAANGVHIGVSAHGMPGSNLHREMWYLWKGGMPVEDVLRATTIGNAEKLGLQDEIGSLEPGKIADFLVLDENPLDDILNTLTLEYTVQGGVVYDSDTGSE